MDDNTLSKIIFYGILLIVVLPVIGDYGALLFPLGRDVLFRGIVEILLLLYLILICQNRDFLPKMGALSWALVGFWGISGLATLFSTQPSFSFWGNPFRGQGFFSQTHFLIFFFIIKGIVRKWKWWRKIIWTAIAVSWPLGLIAVGEALSGTFRVQSTLNNPNFLGAYMLLVFFMTLSLWLKHKRPFLIKSGDSEKLLLICSFLLQFFTLVWTKSRGAYAGLGAGLLVGAGFFVWQKWGQSRLGKKILLGSGAVLIGLTVLFLFESGMIQFVFESLTLPFAQIPGRLGSVKQRLESYRTAVLGIKNRPWLGFGPENFVVAFDKYYSGVLEGTGRPWFDKVHNVFLEVGVTTGILGLVGYVVVWFFALRAAHGPPLQPWVKIGLLATFAAYLTQNMFNIDTTCSFIYVYLWWAMAAVICES